MKWFYISSLVESGFLLFWIAMSKGLISPDYLTLILVMLASLVITFKSIEVYEKGDENITILSWLNLGLLSYVVVLMLGSSLVYPWTILMYYAIITLYMIVRRTDLF